MNRLFSVLLLACVAVAVLGLAGCSNKPGKIYVKTDLVQAGYDLADSLEDNLKFAVSKDQSIIVSSFVNVDNLEESSPFGRMTAEYVASRLAQKGYSIIELKLRQDTLFVKKQKGEFLLSRDVKYISRENNAPLVVVGTYTGGYDKVYVSARIVRTEDNVIVSSSDYAIPMNWKKRNYMLNKNYLDPELQNHNFPGRTEQKD